MEYRQLPHGSEKEKFSVLGLGMGGIQGNSSGEIEAVHPQDRRKLALTSLICALAAETSMNILAGPLRDGGTHPSYRIFLPHTFRSKSVPFPSGPRSFGAAKPWALEFPS